MWTVAELEGLGLNLDPMQNAFTYTFPPPYYAKQAGEIRQPMSFSGASGWPGVGLYLHIPFCRMNCSFCSLHRQIVRDDDLIVTYLAALQREIWSFKARLQSVQVKTIYLGGGTPSILSASRLGRLLDDIEESFCLAPPVEVCIECAPDVHKTSQDWRTFFKSLISRTSLPLNRVSLGVQSFDEKTLRSMGRQGGITAVMDLLYAVDELVPAYNIDIIFGYPEQPSGLSVAETVNGTVAAIEKLINQGLRIPSLSLYQLWDTDTIPIIQKRYSVLPQKETLLVEKWHLQAGLYELGYEPNMASFFIRAKDFEPLWAKYKYKLFCFIGLGSGAYSVFPKEFVQRPRVIKHYISAMQTNPHMHRLDCCYTLSEVEVLLRRIILGLRTCEWITIPFLRDQTQGFGALEECMEKIRNLIHVGILEQRGDDVRLSRDAFMIANEISSYLHPKSQPRKPTPCNIPTTLVEP